MTSEHQIHCINKDDRYNPYERILYIGGINGNGSRWKLSQTEAIKSIESKEFAFFVKKDNKVAKVIVATSPHGNKYIKTEADGAEPNNLLSLPECP